MNKRCTLCKFNEKPKNLKSFEGYRKNAKIYCKAKREYRIRVICKECDSFKPIEEIQTLLNEIDYLKWVINKGR